MPDPVLLMTRPQESAERFVTELPGESAGLPICFSPLLQIEHISAVPDFEGIAGVIFTSSNGVEAVAPRDMAAWCVGRATTLAARKAGWKAQMAGLDSASLIEALCRLQPEGPLLHLRGRHTRGDIAARLSECGVSTREVIVYEQKLLSLSDEADRLLKDGVPIILPLFSPRVARQFAESAYISVNLHVVAISPAVAKIMEGRVLGSLETVETPDSVSLANAVARMAERLRRVEG